MSWYREGASLDADGQTANMTIREASGGQNESGYLNTSTDANFPQQDKLEMFIVPSIYAVVIIGGCVANSFLIVVLYRNRRINRHSTGILMLNLAFADLLFLLFWVPFHTIIYTISYWPFGDFMCRYVGVFLKKNNGTSVGEASNFSGDDRILFGDD